MTGCSGAPPRRRVRNGDAGREEGTAGHPMGTTGARQERRSAHN